MKPLRLTAGGRFIPLPPGWKEFNKDDVRKNTIYAAAWGANLEVSDNLQDNYGNVRAGLAAFCWL